LYTFNCAKKVLLKKVKTFLSVILVLFCIVVVVVRLMMMVGENSFHFLPVVETNFINQTLIKQLLPPN
jgi:hypothetical protein